MLTDENVEKENETLPPSLCFKKVKMILVFGGTTEGRAAVETLDEAGQTYYYSTR